MTLFLYKLDIFINFLTIIEWVGKHHRVVPCKFSTFYFFPTALKCLGGLVSIIHLVDLCMILPFCHVEISFTFGYHFRFCPWMLATLNISRASPSLDIPAPILVPNSDSISSFNNGEKTRPHIYTLKSARLLPR